MMLAGILNPITTHFHHDIVDNKFSNPRDLAGE